MSVTDRLGSSTLDLLGTQLRIVIPKVEYINFFDIYPMQYKIQRNPGNATVNNIPMTNQLVRFWTLNWLPSQSTVPDASDKNFLSMITSSGVSKRWHLFNKSVRQVRFLLRIFMGIFAMRCLLPMWPCHLQSHGSIVPSRFLRYPNS
jgi:hypothetical protein